LTLALNGATSDTCAQHRSNDAADRKNRATTARVERRDEREGPGIRRGGHAVNTSL